MTLDIGAITAIMIALVASIIVIIYTLSENVRLRHEIRTIEEYLYSEEEMTAEEDELHG